MSDELIEKIKAACEEALKREPPSETLLNYVVIKAIQLSEQKFAERILAIIKEGR